eukprot:TRINITY_DN27611_c0_g1_i3.p1 TRINITY_DN27611_c0_g1~~TRINITY_DN27611_c0_g1_i3.p1  ORF type:complete len:143 (+),score=14.41 TRINITY_DN27611_c0_g1_i3:40-429(+)
MCIRDRLIIKKEIEKQRELDRELSFWRTMGGILFGVIVIGIIMVALVCLLIRGWQRKRTQSVSLLMTSITNNEKMMNNVQSIFCWSLSCNIIPLCCQVFIIRPYVTVIVYFVNIDKLFNCESHWMRLSS